MTPVWGILVFALLASLLAAPGARAQDLYPIDDLGFAPLEAGSSASVVQAGERLAAQLLQTGPNRGEVSQVGVAQIAVIEQVGLLNLAIISQMGLDNQAALHQFGSLNEASLLQAGNHNFLDITQVGVGLHFAIEQLGDNNSMTVVQGQ